LCLAVLACACAPAAPRLFFQFHAGFEAAFCPSDIGMPTPRLEWIAEARAGVREAQAIWDREGPSLLASAVEIAGRPFRRREETVTLNLCRTRPSLQAPLLIQFWMFLRGPTKGRPAPPALFVDIVFHELLHNYVSEILGSRKTPLLARYREEPEKVRNHLHLMALQRVVYDRLQRDDLRRVDLTFIRMSSPEYLRAWQIVNDKDAPGHSGWEAFVAELRSAAI
jgi:hypothetical protein